MDDETTHVVADGEWVSAIAVVAGVSKWRKRVWQLPENDDLRERREDPYVLAPGDALALPEDREKLVDCVTEQLQRFRAPEQPDVLRVRLPKPDFNPMTKDSSASKSCAYEVRVTMPQCVGGKVTIDDKGVVTIPLPTGAQCVILSFEEDRGHARCRLGRLRPMHHDVPASTRHTQDLIRVTFAHKPS
ncbi:MAG: hypothetical protein ACOYN0_08855 [Phycisphaerales bacterium]